MNHILIIDDDTTFLDLMKSSLDPSQYSVATAGDGMAGLKSMEEKKPNAILLDITMPGMGGLEFLKEMNAKYGEGTIPVLITSNNSSMDTISEGVALGVRGYVVKSNESLQNILDAVGRIFHTPDSK